MRAFVFIGDISAISAAEEKPERTCAALDLRGFSAADFQEVLTALLGRDAANLSPAVIARLKGEWEEEHRPWQARDLSARRNVDLWADSVYLQARMRDAGQDVGQPRLRIDVCV